MTASETSRNIVRWAARLTGAASLAFQLCLVGAHLVPDSHGPAPTTAEWVGLTFFPTGIIVGLSIAFFRARTGALIAIGSLATFHIWHVLRAGVLPGGPFFLLLTSPAVLFLISGQLDGNAASDHASKHRKPGPSKKRPEEPGCGLGTPSLPQRRFLKMSETAITFRRIDAE